MRFYCIIMKGQKKQFLILFMSLVKIDWLFKWTLRKACSTLAYSWVFWWGVLKSPSVDLVRNAPEKLFLFTTTDRRKLAYTKNKLLVLFCTTTATTMFTIHQIKNSSLVYVKHVLLDISIKGQLESKNCLLFIKSKTPPFI